MLLGSCAHKIVYVPTETVRTEKVILHDTLIDVQLVPIRDSVAVSDTFSLLSNKYAYSSATWHSGTLNHSLVIKDVTIPVRVQYVTVEKHDATTKLMPINKQDQAKLDKFDKLQASDKAKTAKIWGLYGLVLLLTFWTLRKPIIWLASKAIKPI